MYKHHNQSIRAIIASLATVCAITATAQHRGTVYVDTNANGVRDAGESPAKNVVVSDGLNVVKTDSRGQFTLPGYDGNRFVFITTPSGFQTYNRHYLPVDPSVASYDFGIIPYDAHTSKKGAHSFIQVTDSEIFNTEGNEAWVDDIRRFADNEDVAFVIHTGDICYEKGLKEHIGLMNTRNMGLPVYYCIGNHDLVKGKYGEELFENIYGPVYFSFDCGNTHYVVTPMGGGDHRPSYTRDQVARWLRNDLAQVEAGTPVVVFNHDILTTDSTFIYGGDKDKIDFNRYNVKANIYGHWHINHVRKQGDFLTICTSTPDKGGIDHSTGSWRVVNIDNDGNITTRLHYPYLHNHAAIAAPKGLTSAATIVVNAYSSTAMVKSVTASFFTADGRKIGKDVALTPSTDWSWTAVLPAKVKTAEGPVKMKALVKYSDGNTGEQTSEFTYRAGGVSIAPGAAWTNLLGNASHTGGATDAPVDTLPALSSVTNVGANLFMTSPLIYDGKVFSASVDEDMRVEAAVVAVNISDGSIAWKTPVAASVKNSIAISCGKVFAQDVDGTLYAINCGDGSVAWTHKLAVRPIPALIEGLCADATTVFAGTGKGLTAIDATSGKVIWTNSEWGQGEGTTTTLSEGDGVVVGGVQWSALYANDSATGKLLWRKSEHGLSDRGASAAIHNGLVYIISRQSLFIIDAKSGRTIARRELPMKVDVTSTPLLTDKAIVFGSSTDGLIAVDRETFDILWTTPLQDALIYTAPYSRPVSATVETSPVMAGGRIYATASDGTLYSINPSDGKIAWSYQTGAPIFSSPAVSGNALVVTDFGGNIYIFGSPEAN